MVVPPSLVLNSSSNSDSDEARTAVPLSFTVPGELHTPTMNPPARQRSPLSETFPSSSNAQRNSALHINAPLPLARTNSHQPLVPPCFVHNHLDHHTRAQESSDSDSEEEIASITEKLAETAVSVREMSKQLGTTSSLSHVFTIS